MAKEKAAKQVAKDASSMDSDRSDCEDDKGFYPYRLNGWRDPRITFAAQGGFCSVGGLGVSMELAAQSLALMEESSKKRDKRKQAK